MDIFENNLIYIIGNLAEALDCNRLEVLNQLTGLIKPAEMKRLKSACSMIDNYKKNAGNESNK